MRVCLISWVCWADVLDGPGLHYLGLIVVPKQAEGCACLQLPAVAIQPGFQAHGLHDGSCAQGEWWFLEQLVCIHSPAVVSVLWPSLPSPCKPSSQESQLSIARMGAGSSKRTQQLCGGYNLVPSCYTLNTGQSTEKGTPWDQIFPALGKEGGREKERWFQWPHQEWAFLFCAVQS